MAAYPYAYPQDSFSYQPSSHAPVYAGFGIRTLAYFIDSLVLAVVTSLFTHLSPSFPFLAMATAFTYFTFFQSSLGGSASFGQRLFRLRVLDTTGAGLSLGRAALRTLVLGFSFWVFCLGVIWVAIDAKKRGWHDLAARSLVVHSA